MAPSSVFRFTSLPIPTHGKPAGLSQIPVQSVVPFGAPFVALGGLKSPRMDCWPDSVTPARAAALDSQSSGRAPPNRPETATACKSVDSQSVPLAGRVEICRDVLSRFAFISHRSASNESAIPREHQRAQRSALQVSDTGRL
jgi:hypothetical protein